PFTAFRKVLLGVVNDMISADGADSIYFRRTADPGHLSAERLGDLNREHPHASRCPNDQDLLPRCNASALRRARRAVQAEVGTDAARSKVRLAGLGARVSSRADARSAKEPSQVPNTSPPSRNRVTFLPTASTVPATSAPRTRAVARGARSP